MRIRVVNYERHLDQRTCFVARCTAIAAHKEEDDDDHRTRM